MSDIIESNPEILGGKTIIKGTRIPVVLIEIIPIVPIVDVVLYNNISTTEKVSVGLSKFKILPLSVFRIIVVLFFCPKVSIATISMI